MTSLAALAAERIEIPDGGFEAGVWTISERVPMCSVVREPALGKQALMVRDGDEKEGSNATSPRFKLAGPGKYTLQFQAYPISGTGLGVYVQIYDAAGKRLADQEVQDAAPSGQPGKWQSKSLVFYTSPAAASAEIWIHSYGTAKVQAVLDDFTLTREPIVARAPWPGEYKIRPEEKDRLTEADVVGPDGIVYPDWRYAGMPGGIPQVPGKVKIEEFGGVADDGKDDAAALQKACEQVATMGGGAVVMGPGVYHLDRPVLVTGNGVVIRGAGQEKTRLVFRYAVAPKTVQFFGAAEGQVVTPSDWIEAHAHPDELRSITVLCDGKQIARVEQGQHSGNMFSVNIPASQVAAGGMGSRKLVATAEYFDGTKATAEISVRTGKSEAALAHVPRMIGAISFAGASQLGPQIRLIEDGKRGSRQIVLADGASLRAGDRIRLRAPATPRWNELVQNACPWGDYRRYDFVAEKVEGNRITLNQPMRIDFPVIDGSSVQKLDPILRCGAEDFTLEQVENLWINGVTFSEAWECWARGVTVKMAGRNPIYTLGAKWCEIRDCTYDDAHFKGGGGTAYGGFEVTCDSLMENVTTKNLRHAPLFQWSAAGNVIRNSVFHASDGQWHSGWTNENLFENCVIDVKTGNGAYGYGLWASPPEDTAHGPNGPRNVVYNCDVKSPKSGLWMGGMNENWLILYNRFTVGSGPAIFAKSGSFDHIIRGNYFVMEDGKSPVVRLATPDCMGVEVVGNTVAGGNGKLGEGAAAIARDQGNVLKAAGELGRPTPAVLSIFKWQRQNRPMKQP